MKVKTPNLKSKVIEIISLLLIILFVYAAVSKIVEFQNFQAQLGQSPLLSAYTEFISYAILTIEFIVALLLAIPKSRYLALLASYGLMLLFTFYIIVILNFSPFIPCSCGGILDELGWKDHLIFNLTFTLLAAFASLIYAKNTFKTVINLSLLLSICALIILILYYYSEQTMHRENPFIRRFIQGSASKVTTITLDNSSKYFAGMDGETIYLGDHRAPLHMVAFDTTLKIKKHYKIELERENFPFSNVQVRILPPYFYLMDGTVPVIYKGTISNWKAKLWMHSNNYYFSKAEIMTSDTIVFRAQEKNTLHNIIGTFTVKDSLLVHYAPQLLEKQIDGFFDTDGMLSIDRPSQKVIYTYYYRNQFIVADKNLENIKRSNTIDTTTMAKLKIAHIKETGQRKIASLPATVNQVTVARNNLLFINSKIIGRFEPKSMWKEASIIDIYDIEKNIYLSSIYIYDVGKSKVKALWVDTKYLYALIGQELHKYKLSEHIVANNN